jgi:DNA-binding SARP family transcriptional activator/TolB-like protein
VPKGHILPEPQDPSEARGGWSLTLFGGCALSNGELTVDLSKNLKIQALLGYLALTPTRRATREQLAGLLWSESPERQARASLRQALHKLRKLLDDKGVTGIVAGWSRDAGAPKRDEDPRIEPDRIMVDVWSLLTRVQQGEVDTILLERKNICETLLANLDDLDPAFTSWLAVQRQSLHERLVFLLESRLAELGENNEEAGRANQLEKTVSLALMNLDPTHEGSCRRLMLLSARDGDTGGALRRYNTLWNLLDSEHDVEPCEETQRLAAAIKMGNIPVSSREAWRVPPTAPLQFAEAGGAPFAGLSHYPYERRLRIIVVSFDTAGVEPDQRYLVTGFRHQLISSLIRFREWSLIDGGHALASAASTGQANYTIGASSYQARDQLHLMLTLSDAVTGEYVWSEDVSADLPMWFSTQKLVVRRLAVALNVHLSEDRLSRALDQPDVSLAVYDRWLRGEALTRLWRGKNRVQAADIFKSIVAEAPNFAPAYCSMVNFINSRSHIFPGELRTAARKKEALDLAREAVRIDPTYSRTHLCAAWSCALNGYFDQAERSFQLAYELNENEPWTMIASSLGLAFCGQKDLAAARAQLALQLGLCIEPRHWGYQGVVRFLCQDYVGSVAAFDQAEDVIYNFAAWKAAALTHLGRHDTARAEWRRFVDMVSSDWYGEGPPDDPAIREWLLQGFPIKPTQDWERLRDGLPRA